MSRSSRQVTHVLLTRSRLCPRPKPGSSLHLHVLSTPPAFVLSQDQTLRECLPDIRLHTRVERDSQAGIGPTVHSVLAVYVAYPPQGPAGLSKEPRHPKMDGVSTNLALIFGTLLSSQGTDASFVLTLSGFPPGASLRSCVSDSIRSSRPDFLGAFQVPASAFPFPAAPTLSDPFGPDSRSERVAFPAVGPFRRVRL